MTEQGAESFDYIVVGAGTAGCVIASRLSEQPDVCVALLEAGPPDRHPFIHIPAAVGAAIATPAINWRFTTAPQAHLNGRRIPIPRGHVVGGSGSINGMVYFRGHPTDFDDWAAAGNPGWSYREVLPYFLRSENNEAYRGSPYHGQGGPMNVMFVKRPNPMTPAFLAAMEWMGYQRTQDFNGPTSEGYGERQGTMAQGRRVSTATAYLKPALSRPNLRLLTHARVARVVIENRRATGVEVLVDGGTRRLAARREVIVCGGAVLSPQLLMLSGIGDGAALQAHGIEVKQHLPGVGANYHDHLAIAVLLEMKNSESYGISWKALPRDVLNLLEYALFRTGPLSSNVFEATGFIRTLPELARPDVQIVFQAARRNPHTFPFPLGHGYAISVVGLSPKARGRVTLASSDPRAHPIVDPNLLGHPDDVAMMLRGLKIGRRIAHAPSFERYRATEVQPGPDVQDDSALVEYIRRASATVHHPCGSCRMGSDANAVVDAELRVHGIEALRVADASVFPRVVGGNTNAAVVMIGEKASDMIRGIAAPQPIDLPYARSEPAPDARRSA
ncbi:MAG TPA: GMC family oxidoreductase N-terminal domain-containing protein [Steroidobacteraceae bacterium]|jgi:choline dehydrogenase|nr:GMC family oxidoreductase N-terminal domain-containing protein [Steroidobacteraceae bacterium]